MPGKLAESTGAAETYEIAEMDGDGMEDEGVMF